MTRQLEATKYTAKVEQAVYREVWIAYGAGRSVATGSVEHTLLLGGDPTIERSGIQSETHDVTIASKNSTKISTSLFLERTNINGQ